MIVRGRLTALPADTPVPNGTSGELRRAVDNSLIVAVTTTDGWYTYEMDGSPGPLYVQWTYAGVTHTSHSKITGPSAATDVGNVALYMQAFTNGIISGAGANLALTATGAAMNVTVGAGAALVRGILYDRLASSTVPIAAAHATLGRLDYVVVRVVPRGAGENIEGKAELVVITGTPSATPALPALTQTAALYEFAIGYVVVDAAVATIASNKVVYFSTSFVGATPSAGSVTTSSMAANSVTSAAIVNGTITGADIAANTITSSNILDGTILAVDLADGAVTTAKLADLGVTETKLAAAVQTKLNETYTGRPSLMPGTEVVATGTLSVGTTRTLYTLAVGPLTTGVTYDIAAFGGVTVRNNVNSGTVVTKININGGTDRTHEWQNVGGVPRWTEVKQSAAVVGTGAAVNVSFRITGQSGDSTDVRAGEVFVMAIPR